MSGGETRGGEGIRAVEISGQGERELRFAAGVLHAKLQARCVGSQRRAANIRAGMRLLSQTYRAYAYLDSLDRWRFTLATYHAGYGHLSDARRLAIDMGKDPNRWDGSVEVALPRLMEQRYYRQTRHGFYRGAETVAYVQAILHRYRMYRRFAPESVEVEVTLPGLVNPPPPPH